MCHEPEDFSLFLWGEKSDRVWCTSYPFPREVLRSTNFMQGSFMLSAFLSRKKGILPYFVDVTRLQFWHFSASQHIIALIKTQPRLYCSTIDCWLSDAVCIKNRGCGKGMKAVETTSRNPFIPAGLWNDHLTGAISESAIDGVKQPLDQLVGSKKQRACFPKAVTMKNNIIAVRVAFINLNDSSILMIMWFLYTSLLARRDTPAQSYTDAGKTF